MKSATPSWAAWMWGPLQHPTTLPSGYRPLLFVVLVTGFALRLGIGWRLPSIHHADEVYQVAEQAHRRVAGYGIATWEFRSASRAALLPTLVEPIYRLDLGAAARRVVQSAIFCALSLIPVWVAFHWGGRLYGLRGAMLAAAIMAIWFELVFFAPKATADAVGGYFLLLGIFLTRPDVSRGAAFCGGLALMLALGVRIQIAPAIGLALLLALAVAGRHRSSALLVGAAVGLAIVGLVEWRWWGTPFQGQIGYLVMEFTRHSSSYFAQQPLTFYLKQYVLMYAAALPVIAVLIYMGARKAPVLLVSAVAVILPFHFIGHKEYRFVIAALPMLVLLMGLGAADLVTRWQPAAPRSTVPLIIAGWAIAMLAVSFGDTYRPFWTQSRNQVLAFEEVGRQGDACGIALVGMRWYHTPGYSGLGRDIPIYQIINEVETPRILAAANYVLVATKAAPLPPPFERWREYTRPVQYLHKRPGGCVPDPSSRIVAPRGIPGVQ